MNLFGLDISRSKKAAAPTTVTVATTLKTGGELMKSKRFIPSARRDGSLPDTSRMYGIAQLNRLNADWPASISSANAEILVSAIIARSRNRQLERDNDYYRRMLRLTENNVVGHKGIRLQNKAKDLVGRNPNGAPLYRMDNAANSLVEAGWAKWNRPENCTVMRNMSGVDLQRLVVRRFGPDGGILVRLHRGFQNAFRYAVEPLEIDRLNFNYQGINADNGNQIMFGVEYDQFNAHAAYWILTRHPGDPFPNRRKEGQQHFHERVPANEILFIGGSIERAGQMVPMPLWCSVAARLNQLGKFEEAVQVASREAACKGGFITQDKFPEGYTGPVDEQGNPIEQVEPGMIQRLDFGEGFQQYDPKFPMTETQDYIKGQIRGASAGANLASHSVGSDLTEVNFSSIRAGVLEDREEFKTLQQRLIDYLLEPIFNDWLPYALMSGQIPLPLAKLEKFSAPSWRPRRWDWVDPEKDVNATIKSIAARLSSREDAIEESGKDMEEVDAQFDADEQLADLPVENAYLNNYVAPTPAEAKPAAKEENP